MVNQPYTTINGIPAYEAKWPKKPVMLSRKARPSDEKITSDVAMKGTEFFFRFHAGDETHVFAISFDDIMDRAFFDLFTEQMRRALKESGEFEVSGIEPFETYRRKGE